MMIACELSPPLPRKRIMSWDFTGFLLALFGLSLILITLSLWLLRGASGPGEAYSPFARFFLIALRVFIGWHCFIEGMEKISTPTWSSEAYLRESSGPLAGIYRAAAGDRLIDRLTLGPDHAFPDELERDWNNYLAAFSRFYELTGEQMEAARRVLEQRKEYVRNEFISRSAEVTKLAPYPPPLEVKMTLADRLKEHERLLELVRSAEAKFPSAVKEVHAEWKAAKADLAKWRSDLKKSADAATADFKKKLYDDVLTSAQRQLGPIGEPIPLPMTAWRFLEASDFAVKWGLVVLGACLMLGFLSRLSSAATGLLILSFYLAMPPLPGWPESPRLEGHYLLINKTLIEVVALFALAFIPTGRWAGVDGLFGLFRKRKPAEAV
jgi:uncharacterized membrane protein YphA (DoxX/SURF4 family)